MRYDECGVCFTLAEDNGCDSLNITCRYFTGHFYNKLKYLHTYTEQRWDFIWSAEYTFTFPP